MKKAVLHRKNAYFYKTQEGARIGDMYMSLIYTAERCGALPFEYLVALQRHAVDVEREPSKWMPWNFDEAVAEAGATAGEVERASAGSP